jgi:hypothetical protein
VEARLPLRRQNYLFHGAWAFRREAFDRMHGYPFEQSGQYQGLLRRFKAAKLRHANPIQFDARPSYIYHWFTSHNRHVSALGKDGYERLASDPCEHVRKIAPAWDRDYLALHAAATSEVIDVHEHAARSFVFLWRELNDYVNNSSLD